MKRWHKRTVAVLALGAVGFAALALRPALVADKQLADALSRDEMALAPDQAAAAGQRALCYRMGTARCPGITLMESSDGVRGFSELLQDAVWVIDARVRDGKLMISAPPPLLHAKSSLCRVISSSSVSIRGTHRVRMPDGKTHVKYVVALRLRAEIQPSFWAASHVSEMAQVLLIDPVAGTMDYLNPEPYFPVAAGELTVVPADGELPQRYSGSATRQEMLRMLDLLASVTNGRMADAAGMTLAARADNFVALMAEADAAWPECWGTDAATARELHEAVVPTLLFLQRNACFDSQALADFINSEDFGRIFGESFADVKLSDPEAEPGGRTEETDGLPVIVGDEADDSAMNAGDDEAVEVEDVPAAAEDEAVEVEEEPAAPAVDEAAELDAVPAAAEDEAVEVEEEAAAAVPPAAPQS